MRCRVLPIIMSFQAVLLSACNGEIYLRDGVTDGDTFYLSDIALTNDDPALQSWVGYSLIKSACQLQAESANPARATSYGCEFSARRHLIETWQEQKSMRREAQDDYLDELLRVREAGYLDEYVAHYFARKSWQLPAELDAERFDAWRHRHLRGHRPRTRLVGSWNYAGKVSGTVN
ncbi:MAG: hypothetical protein ACREQZ_11850 [Woeseiaceae bacterium]